MHVVIKDIHGFSQYLGQFDNLKQAEQHWTQGDNYLKALVKEKTVKFEESVETKTVTEETFKRLCRTLEKYDRLSASKKKTMTGDLYRMLNLIYNNWEDYITKGR